MWAESECGQESGQRELVLAPGINGASECCREETASALQEKYGLIRELLFIFTTQPSTDSYVILLEDNVSESGPELF